MLHGSEAEDCKRDTSQMSEDDQLNLALSLSHGTVSVSDKKRASQKRVSAVSSANATLRTIVVDGSNVGMAMGKNKLGLSCAKLRANLAWLGLVCIV